MKTEGENHPQVLSHAQALGAGCAETSAGTPSQSLAHAPSGWPGLPHSTGLSSNGGGTESYAFGDPA